MRAPYVLLPTAILFAATPALASSGPMLQTNHSCYLVGTPVSLSGSGFAPYRQYEVALDGVNFGVGTTDPSGGFTATLRPGGLGANVVQRVDTLRASDGVRAAARNFTLTRAPGARILAGTGSARSFRAPFQVWGFTLGRVPPAPYDIAHSRQSVFVHYLSPHRRVKTTVALGITGGQCGYLQTKPRRVFPFIPSRGKWTLQVDTIAHYLPRPPGPWTRIPVSVS